MPTYIWDGPSQSFVPSSGAGLGVTDGSEAAPGQVGEFLEEWGSTTGTTQLTEPIQYPQVGTSVALTAGDWMVGGAVQMEQVGTPTSLVAALLGDATNPYDGSWCVLRGVTAQDLSLTFDPIRFNTATPIQVGIFLGVVTAGSASTVTFPVNWDIWARRMR